jgi:hypothetical protein
MRLRWLWVPCLLLFTTPASAITITLDDPRSYRGWEIGVEGTVQFGSEFFYFNPLLDRVTSVQELFPMDTLAILGGGDTLDPDTPIVMTLRKTLHVYSAGGVSALGYFYNGDPRGLDAAWVTISDAFGTVIATPWTWHAGDNPLQTARGRWWQWRAEDSGDYTIELGLRTRPGHSSYAIYTNIQVAEPSSALLLVLGCLVTTAHKLKSAAIHRAVTAARVPEHVGAVICGTAREIARIRGRREREVLA